MLNTAPLGAQHGRPARALRGGLCSNWASTSYCCLGTCSGSVEILERGHPLVAEPRASGPDFARANRLATLLPGRYVVALSGAANRPGCFAAPYEVVPFAAVLR